MSTPETIRTGKGCIGQPAFITPSCSCRERRAATTRPLCLLPRGGRCGGRSPAAAWPLGQAGLVAGQGGQSLRRPAQPPVMQALMPHARTWPAPGSAAGGHRSCQMDLEQALTPTFAACSATATWWPAWWARCRRASASKTTPPRSMRQAGPGLPAHQHHPRRGRGTPCAGAGERAAAVRGHGHEIRQPHVFRTVSRP